MSAIFDFIYINFGLFTKLAVDQYGSRLEDTNLVWCRIRVYLTWILPCIATSYLVLASIDRCLSTSTNIRFRSFSQIKVAHRLTCIPIVLYSLTSSHQLVYYDLRPKCASRKGLIPQSAILIFGLITYYNVRKSHQCRIHRIEQHRNRPDSQMIKITLLQVLCSSILLNIRTVSYSYDRFSIDIRKDDYPNTLSSRVFRKVFKERLIIFYRRIICYKN